MHAALRPVKCTDGARVRDALHTVLMDSGASAYERLIWQLGFTIVEVPALNHHPLMGVVYQSGDAVRVYHHTITMQVPALFCAIR